MVGNHYICTPFRRDMAQTQEENKRNKEYKARSGSDRDLRCMQEQHKKLKADKRKHRENLERNSTIQDT